MKLEPNEAGFTIEATDLGRLLDLPPAEVQQLMRAGEITSRSERGEGEDAGRFRLTFFHGKRRVQLVLPGDGEVVRRSRVTWSDPPAASAGPESPSVRDR